jgi:hypothetical protein
MASSAYDLTAGCPRDGASHPGAAVPRHRRGSGDGCPLLESNRERILRAHNDTLRSRSRRRNDCARLLESHDVVGAFDMGMLDARMPSLAFGESGDKKP